MKRECGKTEINGELLLPDNADGEETCWVKIKEVRSLCKLLNASEVLLQSCLANINARMEACVRVCM